MISKDKITQNSKFNPSNSLNLNSKNKVNINTLLNRVRADKRKEKIEVYLFFGFISYSSTANLSRLKFYAQIWVSDSYIDAFV